MRLLVSLSTICVVTIYCLFVLIQIYLKNILLFFYISLDSNQADGPPDVKWSPLPIDICNTKALQVCCCQDIVEMSHVPIVTSAPRIFKPELANTALRRYRYGGSTSPGKLLHKELYYCYFLLYLNKIWKLTNTSYGLRSNGPSCILCLIQFTVECNFDASSYQSSSHSVILESRVSECL